LAAPQGPVNKKTGESQPTFAGKLIPLTVSHRVEDDEDGPEAAVFG
jgi:hypothetical protein